MRQLLLEDSKMIGRRSALHFLRLYRLVFFSLLFAGQSLAVLAQILPEGLTISGMLDLRGIASSKTRSFEDGGVGLTRFGADRAGRQRLFADVPVAAFMVNYRISYDLSFESHWRADASSRARVDAIEAFLRYAPVSTDAFKFQLRGGAFLPPISLGETAYAWTSAYNLTPAALTAWLGEEIKTIGLEGAMMWRGEDERVDARLGLYGANEPAGASIAARGFALTDRLAGLFDPRVALPVGYVNELRQIDDRLGLYASVTYVRPDLLTLRAVAYDNLADAKAVRAGRASWRTRFYSIGADLSLPMEFTLMGQAMTGTTRINPVPSFLLDVQFDSAFVMLAKDIGRHRLSARIEQFRVSDLNRLGPIGNDQRGHALSLAYVNWLNRDLRLTVEQLMVNSVDKRRQRLGLAERQDELQFQTSLRYYFHL